MILASVLSCDNDDEENVLPTNYTEAVSPLDSALIAYLGEDFKSEFELYSYVFLTGDYKDNEGTKAAILGVKDGRLWLGIFDAESKKKVFEWTDASSFEYHRTINKGYGEYEEVDIATIQISALIQTSKGYLLRISYNLGGESYFGESYSLYNSNLEKLDYSIYERWFDDYILGKRGDWYNDIIVSPKGDILEDFTALAIKELKDTELLSYCEGIRFSDFVFSCIKYEKTIWKTEYKPNFEVESDTKIESSIVEKNTDTWVYQLVFTYYSGEKKSVEIVLNLNDGAISERK